MASILSAGTTNSTALNLTADTSGSLILASNNNVTAVTIDANQNATFASSVNAPNTFGFKNRIMNGGMVIDQRNAGASVTNIAGGVYTIDRWIAYGSQASKFTIQQNAGSVTPPSGFTNYVGITSSSAYTVGSGEEFEIYQWIEGFNFADLGFGTANAKTVTLSFWVRSSLTGTFGGSLQNSASTRSNVFSYTILAANTWEQKTITIAGDTSGTWIGATNGRGIGVFFGLGQGSSLSTTAGSWVAGNYNNVTGGTSVVGTNGATFYITGVQLETGTKATSFDYRPYGTEFSLCQRYFQSITQINYIGAAAYSTNRVLSGMTFTGGTMRIAPSITINATYFTYFYNGTAYSSTAISATPYAAGNITLDVTVTATAGLSGVGSVGAFTLSAEL